MTAPGIVLRIPHSFVMFTLFLTMIIFRLLRENNVLCVILLLILWHQGLISHKNNTSKHQGLISHKNHTSRHEGQPSHKNYKYLIKQQKPEALKSLYRSPGYKKPIGPM